MIKGKVEIIKDYGTPKEQIVYADNNMIVDGAGEIISNMMTLPPDGGNISSASSIYDVSNFTIKAVSFGKAPLHYYYNAHQNSGPAKYAREASGQIWVSSNAVSGASSYTPAYYLPDAPIPTDRYLVNFEGITLPEEVVETIVQTIIDYINTSGLALGWGEYSTYPQYKIPSNLSSISSIAAGYNHFVALTSGGQVSCWGGSNNYGELSKPTLPVCSAVGASKQVSFAISQTGDLYSWGLSSLLNYPLSYTTSVSAVTGGDLFFVVQKNDGTVSAWSNFTTFDPPQGIQGRVTKIKSNWPSNHAVAILDDQTVSGWLLRSSMTIDQGQVNFEPITEATEKTATKLSNRVSNLNFAIYHNYAISSGVPFGWKSSTTNSLYDYLNTPNISNAKKIAVRGGLCTICVNTDGTVSGWGNNSSGVLNFSSVGLNNITDLDLNDSTSDPTVVFITSTLHASSYGGSLIIPTALQGQISSISIGKGIALYLTSAGYVSAKSFLGNDTGAVTSVNVIPSGLQGSCIAISMVDRISGTTHRSAMGLKKDGTVYRWGFNGSFVPTGLSSVSAIAEGFTRSIALKNNGVVSAWSWGGQTFAVPSALQGSCIDISTYGTYFLGLRSDGKIFHWFENDPPPTNIPITTIPSTIYYQPAPTNVIDVATGRYHTLILQSDGTVSAYGRNVEGQCNVPPFVQGLTTKVAANEYQSFAVLNDGRIWGWGLLDSNPGNLLAIPDNEGGARRFYDLAVNYNNAVGLYASTIPYYYTTTSTPEQEDNTSFYNSENYRQNVNLIPFKNTVVNKINVINQVIDVIPSTVGALLDGAYAPSGGITVRLVSGIEPYTNVVSASLSGTFNTVGSMDFRGYVNTTSGTNPLSGLVTSSVNVSSNGELIYIVTIDSDDCAMANLYGGITQMGLWTYDLPANLNSGFNPPYTFRRYPEETGTYTQPLKYKLFAKKVFNENIVKIKDVTTNAGLLNHQNLTIRWRLYFI